MESISSRRLTSYLQQQQQQQWVREQMPSYVRGNHSNHSNQKWQALQAYCSLTAGNWIAGKYML
jgi:hypothetical protein